MTTIMYESHYMYKLSCRVYYPKMEVNLASEVLTYSAPWNHGRDYEDMTQTSKLIHRLVNTIRGVTKISVSAYELHVHKSPVYSWDEIHPQVLAVLSDIFVLDEINDYSLEQVSANEEPED